MLELRVDSPELDKWMLRASRYGMFDAFLAGTNEPGSIISPELTRISEQTVNTDVKVPVFDSETVTVGSTRSVTITDSENTSALYTVSYTTYSWGFTIIPSLFMNNEISIQKDFNRKFLKYLYQFADDLDTACGTALNTNKSQVFANDLGHTPVANVITASDANKERLAGDLSVIMKANDYYGSPYRMITNTGYEAIQMQQREHATFNDQNKAIEFQDKTFHYTNRITDAGLDQATGYIVNPNCLGLLFRHERESILKTSLPDGTAWDITTLPLLGIPIDTYFYYGVGDYNAISGAASADMTRAAKEFYGFAIDVATVVSYNDDLTTVASPVVKFAVTDA
jgi:hypothetical protein